MSELDKLRQMLDEAHIPYESKVELVEDKKWIDDDYKKFMLEEYGDAGDYWWNQVIYGKRALHDWKLDAIFHHGSYGSKNGLLETYGELGVGEDGEPRVLTAEEVFEIIKNDYERDIK